MIKVENVTKQFGALTALKDVTFQVGRGEIVGFLGQNGAGKTTLMRILTTYLSPTKGRVLINAKDIVSDPMRARRTIGYLPETPPLYDYMTVYDYLKFAAKLKDVSFKELKTRLSVTLDDCRLGDVQGRVIRNLS